MRFELRARGGRQCAIATLEGNLARKAYGVVSPMAFGWGVKVSWGQRLFSALLISSTATAQLWRS